MFLICGEALFDVFIDPIENGSLGSDATALRAVAGGSPYNVAIGLARLGRKTALCTEISPDRLGKRLESALSDEGVDLSFIRRAQGATPLALVDVDDHGLPHYGFHGLRQMCLHPVAATFQAQRERITGIHVGSFPIVSEKSAEKLLALVADAGERIVSLDPNVRLTVEPDVTLWRSQLDRFRVHAHLIKTSVEDLEAIYGVDADVEAIARRWLGEKTKLIVLTRGERGGVLFAGHGERIEIEAIPTAVVDTVGAGDTYQAALLCWLDEAGLAHPTRLAGLSRAQLTDMARFAGLAASITCSRRGPDLPRRDELHAHPAAVGRLDAAGRGAAVRAQRKPGSGRGLSAAKLHRAITIVGWAASIMAVIMYMSYIDQIALNMTGQKGSWVLPLAAIVNCALWVTYALLKPEREWPIVVANAPGVVLGAVTLMTAL